MCHEGVKVESLRGFVKTAKDRLQVGARQSIDFLLLAGATSA